MMNGTQYLGTKRAGTRTSCGRAGRRSAIRRRGSVLVEAAAATLFLLVPLVMGVIQFGLYYNASNVVSQVSREGGRYAAVYVLTQPDNHIKDRMVEVGVEGGVPLKKNDISITYGSGGKARYQPVTVTVSYNLGSLMSQGGKRITPFYNPGTITRSYTAMIE